MEYSKKLVMVAYLFIIQTTELCTLGQLIVQYANYLNKAVKKLKMVKNLFAYVQTEQIFLTSDN